MARGDFDDDSSDALPLADLLRAELARRGVASSAQLQQALGKSQPTLSRVLRSLAAEVVVLGRQRSARYALPQPILGHDGRQPLWWTDERGVDLEFGTLTHLAGGRLHVAADGIDLTTAPGALPWFLAPLRLQGFLGRQWARAAGYDPDPARWRIDQLLALLLRDVRDLPGAIWPGELKGEIIPEAPTDAAALAAHFDRLADDAGRTLPAGSSAAGEQPKFIAGDGATGRHWIVKFTPPRGTPFGERWHDLLLAEHAALAVLAEHGVPVAQAELVCTACRTHLASRRFDRIGDGARHGRRHVVPLDAVHDAFVPGPRRHWAATCEALLRQRRLPPEAGQQAAALRAFGNLIGNTDMHFGNLSVVVTTPAEAARGRFTLAPVYDMLPMRWRPDPHSGALDLLPFRPEPADLVSPAKPVALRFWERVEALADASPGFRALAGEMARRIAAG